MSEPWAPYRAPGMHAGSLACADCYRDFLGQYQSFPTLCGHVPWAVADAYQQASGVVLPVHLLDDAPSRRCGRCGRTTWSVADFGGECRMSQPDGYPCGGRFDQT